jgi:hypothetical protein
VIPAREDRLAIVTAEDRLLILPLERRDPRPIVLSGASVHIWSAVDGERSLDQIVELLAEEFAIEPSDIESDVRDCFDELGALGLLVDNDCHRAH